MIIDLPIPADVSDEASALVENISQDIEDDKLARLFFDFLKLGGVFAGLLEGQLDSNQVKQVLTNIIRVNPTCKQSLESTYIFLQTLKNSTQEE